MLQALQWQGSASSPIVISDDEDEGLFVPSSNASENPTITHAGHLPEKGHCMLLRKGYQHGRGLGVELDGKSGFI
jgi:hypothetical protein